jgi:hypothetical protein
MAPVGRPGRSRRSTIHSKLAREQTTRRALSVSDTGDDSDDVPLASRRPRTRLSSLSKVSQSQRDLPTRDVYLSKATGGGKDASGASLPEKRKRADTNTPRKNVKKRMANRSLGASRRRNTKTQVLVDRKTYNWPLTLPYQIMLQIFQYAAYPLVNEQFVATPSVTWLLRTARVCRAFMEPALSALYYSPPLLPASRAHGLFQCLENQDDSNILNYRSKIRYLDIEAVNVLTHKHAGRHPISLQKLVALLPHVQGLRVHLHTDMPGTVEIGRRVAPVYSNELFDQLDTSKVTLRQWKWNYQIMTGNTSVWDNLSSIHSRPSFRMLKDLDIAHVGDRLRLNKNRWEQLIAVLAESFGSLPSLQALTFTKCRIDANENLLKDAPSLRNLSFVDCDGLNSNYLRQLLKSRGGQLTKLVLKHNRFLDLGFIPYLADDCPALQSFEVDFQCFSNSLITGTAEPLFEVVLSAGTKPTWPRSLQHIDIAYIRKWDVATAKDFFGSILDSATDFTRLRSLVIKASLECDWKERIQFRDTWIQRLEDAFQRRAPPPISRGRPNTESNEQRPYRTKSSARLKAASSNHTILAESNTPGMQPLCDLVDIRIDNLRPMQSMYNEGHFMDDEPSDDDDFDPNRVERGQEPYAW